MLTLSESQSHFPYLPNGACGTDHTGLLGLRECMESNCLGAWCLGDPQFMIHPPPPPSLSLFSVSIISGSTFPISTASHRHSSRGEVQIPECTHASACGTTHTSLNVPCCLWLWPGYPLPSLSPILVLLQEPSPSFLYFHSPLGWGGSIVGE